ncbi:MAG: hypothetical protein NZ872_06650, partial [Archaeoglobaceae archaeon]|nr:hypothetical protein [Archaeoglobaceae archaeon]MDW8128878.1 hypothetical protein [Archaeoglobaceae archaeon]
MFLDKSGPEFIIAFVNNSSTISNCNPLPDHFRLYCLNISTSAISNFTFCSGIYDRRACIFNTTAGELRYEYKDWILSMEAGAIFSKYGNVEHSKLLYEPRILLTTKAGTSKYLVITIPSLEGNLSLSGTGRFKFMIEELNWSYARIDNLNERAINEKFENAYIIVKGTEHQQGWCEFFNNFG